MTGSNEFKLNQPPEDGISSVKFSPNTSQFLLVSSWDNSVRLYDVPANTMRLKYQHTGAVLDCAFYVSILCLFVVFDSWKYQEGVQDTTSSISRQLKSFRLDSKSLCRVFCV